MSSDLLDLAVAAEQIFAGATSFHEETYDDSLWNQIEELGFTLVSVNEAAGGSGGTLEQAAVLQRVAARHSVRIPLAETAWLAAWALAASNRAVPAGPLTAAVLAAGDGSIRRTSAGWEIHGRAVRVPWASVCVALVLLIQRENDSLIVVVPRSQFTVAPGQNVAGEPRDDVILDGVHVAEDAVTVAGLRVTPETLKDRGALARVVSLSGAAQTVLALAVTHASERQQFGRPIGQNQVIQHYLASVAAESRCLDVSADAAVTALQSGDPNASLMIAAAKSSASHSVNVIASHGHQVLGAMGFTREHPLYRSTTRLWAWRDEYGDELESALTVGRGVVEHGTRWNLAENQ